MSWLQLFLVFIVIIIFVAIAVLNATAAGRIASIKDYESNPELKKAHEILSWSSVLGWLGVFGLAAVMAYYFSVDDTEKEGVASGLGVKLALVITFGLVLTTGILSAYAATTMDKTTGTVKTELDDTGARGMTNWSAILGIGGVILIGIAIVFSYFYKPSSKSKEGVSETEEPGVEEMMEL